LAGAAAAGHSINAKKATTADKLIDCFADFSEKDYSTLNSLIKSLSTPSSQSTIQSIIPKFNPEIFLQEPKKQTPEQLLEKDIFKKFRLTYTGNVPIKVDMLLNKLGNLTQDQQILEGEAPFDIANLQDANSMNTLLLYGNPGNGKSYMIGELS
jgi:DNA replication protein DnaC